ncbi:MAG: hypothetical protein ACRDQD_20235, partial [Nocardioidaceae bacterium]
MCAAYALSCSSFSAYLRGETCTAMDTAAAARNLAARTDGALVCEEIGEAARALDAAAGTASASTSPRIFPLVSTV